jgi:hypothetical protein
MRQSLHLLGAGISNEGHRKTEWRKRISEVQRQFGRESVQRAACRVIHQAGAFSVTRTKTNMKFHLVHSHALTKQQVWAATSLPSWDRAVAEDWLGKWAMNVC